MGIMEQFFGGKSTVITAALANAEIDRCETEIASLHGKMNGAMAGLATMSDADHIATDADIAATKRAIARLDARVAYLTTELPRLIAAEEAADKAAADEALRQRAEAARKANTVDAAKLLAEYDKLAAPMANILASLAEIDATRDAVNAELQKNLVAEGVIGYSQLHRKTANRPATTQTELRKCWVYRYPASPRDTEQTKYVQIPASEEVRVATIGPDGKPLPVGNVNYDQFGRNIIIEPRLETREVVINRTPERAGRHEAALNGIQLPPGFAGGKHHWPR